MNNDLITGSRPLAKGAVQRLRGRPGGRIECLGGCLWITQDGDPRDIVLRAGEGFDFDRRGDVVANAFDDSRFLLLAA